MNSKSRIFSLLSALLLCSIATASFAAEIEVRIGDEKILLLDTELEGMIRQTAKATDHGGDEAKYTGVPLHVILERAGFDFGESFRGKALAQYVLVTAADGYRAIFSLPELDPNCTDNPVILVDRVNDERLPDGQRPFRLVLPKEKRHFRWIRQVIRLEVLLAPALPSAEKTRKTQ